MPFISICLNQFMIKFFILLPIQGAIIIIIVSFAITGSFVSMTLINTFCGYTGCNRIIEIQIFLTAPVGQLFA